MSRMDPMKTYDPAAIASQIVQHHKTASALEADAAAFTERAKFERQQAAQLEQLLRTMEAQRGGDGLTQ
jgi:hypothetical protein